MSDISTASMSARPIILLGYVGVGKTMFLRHLIRVDASDVLREAIVLYVDLGRDPALESLEPFIAEHFTAELADKYDIDIYERSFVMKVYAAELERFRTGIWSEYESTQPDLYTLKRTEVLGRLIDNRRAHLERSLAFLAQVRKRKIVTVLDNVDQRPSHVQDRVFLLAETLAKSWPGTVFVALRPDTFNRSIREGTLSAYLPRVFAVDPPRIDRVLEKRLQYARREIARQRSETNDLSDVEALDSFLEVVRLSLRRSKALAEMVDNLSGQNARRALGLLTAIVGSPHVRPREALERLGRSRHYSLPFHQALKAVMLGDRQRYDPGASRVVNVLDVSSDDGREHFLLPIIVALLRRAAEPGVEEGFVAASRVFSHCQRTGFRPEQITWQLERAVAGRLIEASPLDGAPEYYRATSVGAYTVGRLIGDLTYLDEVSVDTPIIDDITRAVTQDAVVASERVQRADRFARYLDQQWLPLAGADTGFDWVVPRQGLAAAISDLEKRLDRSAPRRRSGLDREE